MEQKMFQEVLQHWHNIDIQADVFRGSCLLHPQLYEAWEKFACRGPQLQSDLMRWSLLHQMLQTFPFAAYFDLDIRCVDPAAFAQQCRKLDPATCCITTVGEDYITNDIILVGRDWPGFSQVFDCISQRAQELDPQEALRYTEFGPSTLRRLIRRQPDIFYVLGPPQRIGLSRRKL